MDSERSDIKRLFMEVVDLPTAERAAWLDEHAPDPEARAEVEALLEEHEGGTDVLSRLIRHREAAGTTDAATAAMAPQDLDEFRILREIGRGGMAVVYLARDTNLNRLVALKVLPDAFARSEPRVARFRHEAKAVARLKHPGIAAVYRTGETSGRHFIAMEYIEGSTYATDLRMLRRLPDDERSRTIRSDEYLTRTAALLARVADALDHAHQHDIIHRDVKPSNILIDTEGAPHVADFGVAKNLAEPDLTTTGETPGTWAYMSPEQATARSTAIDLRSDIYSLGVVLYQALTLELPFRGTPQEILHQVLTKRPRPVRAINPAVPRDLETIVHKALEKEPAHRYQTAAHLAADLRCYAAGLPILARPPHPVRRARLWVRRHRRPISAAAIVLMVLTFAGVIFVRDVVDARRRQCWVRLVTDRPGADVFVQRFDDRTLELGPVLRSGPVPDDELLLRPGLYRFTVTDGDDFAEITELLEEPGVPIEIKTPIAAAGAAVAGMVEVPAGLYVIGAAGSDYRLTAERRIRLPGFLIDATEVSNAQYLAFVQATAHRRPASWTDGYDPAYADRPVVGVTQQDARMYARWCGRRLPTMVEWEAAARAPDGRRMPWGDGPPPGVDPVPAEVLARRESDEPDVHFALYRKWTVDVATFPALRSPLGLYHAWGNVREWVDNVNFDRSGARVVKGGWWGESGEHSDLSRITSMPGGRYSANIGFRCARSLTPPPPP